MSDIVVKHRVYVEAAVSRVFSMLTSSDGWTRWFAQDAHVEPRSGGVIRFAWQKFGADRVTAKDEGHVIELTKDKSFAFTWQPGQHPTTVALSFEARGQGCVIDLRESGYRFDRDDVEVALHVASGWGEALTLFKFYVEHSQTYGEVPPA